MNRSDIKRFAKYMVGGGVYFWSGYAVFAACYSGFKWSWLPAKIAADIIGWSLGYLVQRFWAFSDRAHLSEMQHAGRYVFIETIGFILDYAIVGGLNAIGITPYVGFFIAAGFFTIWNYLWYKYWVFPEGKILYHASPNAQLEILKPQRTLSKDKYIGDYVFATTNKQLATMYLASKGRATLMNTLSKPQRIIICDEESNYKKDDKRGVIYELPMKDFEKTPQAELDDYEMVSKKVIKPLRKTIYESSLKAMIDADIEVYFVTKEKFDEIVSQKNEDEAIAELQPYKSK